MGNDDDTGPKECKAEFKIKIKKHFWARAPENIFLLLFFTQQIEQTLHQRYLFRFKDTMAYASRDQSIGKSIDHCGIQNPVIYLF